MADQAAFPSAYKDLINQLGFKLMSLWSIAEQERQPFEDRWVKDLRQIRGISEDQELALLSPERSRIFIKQTALKAKTVTARMLDLLFPANGKNNWKLTPTPIPELHPAAEQELERLVRGVLTMSGHGDYQPSAKELLMIQKEIAEQSCNAMSLLIQDQLAEGRYRFKIENVIHSGNSFGTGVLKGPLLETKMKTRWIPDGSGAWTPVQQPIRTMAFWHVPLWDLYPDLSARRIEDCQFVFQRHTVSKSELMKMAARPDFDQERILRYIYSHPTGDVQWKPFEMDIHSMASAEDRGFNPASPRNHYELKEFWGWVDIAELKDSGLNPQLMGLEDRQAAGEVYANVWLLGPLVIKANVSPVQGMMTPYKLYYFDKDESSLFGDGIATIMRDSQKAYNACVRLMLDNASIASGPVFEVNAALLAPGQKPNNIRAFQVLYRMLRNNGIDDPRNQLVRIHRIPGMTAELMQLANFFLNIIDEETGIPRFQHGDNTGIKGAGETARGLSMLMGAANILGKNQVVKYDLDVTEGFIEDCYHLNMQFSDRPDVKGDYEVQATGNTSLVAQEIRAQELESFARFGESPVYAPYVNHQGIVEKIAEAKDLGKGVVRSKEEVSGVMPQAPGVIPPAVTGGLPAGQRMTPLQAQNNPIVGLMHAQ